MFEEIAARIGAPVFAIFRPTEPFYWLYLASTAAVALGICLGRRRELGADAIAASLREVFDPKVFFHRSAMVDYRFILLNHLISVFVLGAGIVSAEAVASGGATLLEHAFGSLKTAAPGLGASVAITVALFVAGDFANFTFHYLQHRVPALWELHKVHHSAEVLTPLTALRVHPIAALLGAQFIATCMGLTSAVFLWLFHGPVAQVTILGANAGVFLWHSVLGKHLAHTHVWVMLPRGVRRIFYSPALHLIHHSADPRHFGKNLGFGLLIWDQLAGTHYEPSDAERHGLILGIAPEEMEDYQTAWRLYWTPLRKIVSRRRTILAPA